MASLSQENAALSVQVAQLQAAAGRTPVVSPDRTPIGWVWMARNDRLSFAVCISSIFCQTHQAAVLWE